MKKITLLAIALCMATAPFAQNSKRKQTKKKKNHPASQQQRGSALEQAKRNLQRPGLPKNGAVPTPPPTPVRPPGQTD